MKKHYRLAQTSKCEPVLFVNGNVASEFSSISRKWVEKIASIRGLYLYGEMCSVKCKHLYKVGKVVNGAGGVINLLTTYSKAEFNRYIVEGKI